MKLIARNWKFAASISGKTNKFIRTMRSKEKDWEILEMFVEGCSNLMNVKLSSSVCIDCINHDFVVYMPLR